MTKKKQAKKAVVIEKEAAAVEHAYESHVAFIQYKTETWEAIAQAIDALGELAGDDEKAMEQMRIGRGGLAYTLLKDMGALQELYQFMFETGVELQEKALGSGSK